MPTDVLPDNPDLDRLKTHAKGLHYDFASWTTLRDYVIVVNRLTRSPHEELAAAMPSDNAADGQPTNGEVLAARFLRLACLNYGADNEHRWNGARRIVHNHPRLAGFSIFTAAAVGDVVSATEFLRSDPRHGHGEPPHRGCYRV